MYYCPGWTFHLQPGGFNPWIGYFNAWDFGVFNTDILYFENRTRYYLTGMPEPCKISFPVRNGCSSHAHSQTLKCLAVPVLSSAEVKGRCLQHQKRNARQHVLSMNVRSFTLQHSSPAHSFFPIFKQNLKLFKQLPILIMRVLLRMSLRAEEYRPPGWEPGMEERSRDGQCPPKKERQVSHEYL
jgi:hypothetical protein